uniref:PH domain-containing protein n=1 Tax=Setaria digitata TaxID=48799 RepID=A0A915PMH2_9BILA
MNEQREIVKASWLQHVMHKKGGTLHRKKKILYEEGKWVVFCVHNGRVPLLEWYFSEEYVHGHRPSKVIDLLDSSFVRVVMSDQSRRSFMIGFSDCSREAIELSALTIEDCDDWIRSTTSTLVRLKCLMESTNLYILEPNVPSESPRTTRRFIDEGASIDEIPEELAPSLPVPPLRSTEYECIGLPSLIAQTSRITSLPCMRSRGEKKNNRGVVKTPPPLPPRSISSSQAQVSKISAKRCSVYDNPKNCASTSCTDSSVEQRPKEISVNSQNSLYSTLEEPTLLDTEIVVPMNLYSESVKRGYSVPTRTLDINTAQSRRIATNNSLSSGYDSPCGVINRISSVTTMKFSKSHLASRANSSGTFAEDYYYSQCSDSNTIPSGLKNLTLQPFICTQHIAYVDFGGKIWITGWTAIAEKYIAGQLCIGDQLVRVADVDVCNTQQIPSIFNAVSRTGLSVLRVYNIPDFQTSKLNITIQRVPYGTIYTLQKTKEEFDAGFILDKRKIKLADVLEGSPAWEAGIRASVPAVTRTGTTPACITCIDKHALNIFARDDEATLKHISNFFTLECSGLMVGYPFLFSSVTYQAFGTVSFITVEHADCGKEEG